MGLHLLNAFIVLKSGFILYFNWALFLVLYLSLIVANSLDFQCDGKVEVITL